MTPCPDCGRPLTGYGHACQGTEERIKPQSNKLQVEADLNIVKNSTDTAVNRLVVWLTDRALKEDSR